MFTLLSLDLVLEILYRLPVKSLLILKSVCKPLNSIISDPNFTKDHLHLSQTRHYHLILCQMCSRSFSKRYYLLFDYRLPSVFDNSTASTAIIPETMLKFPLNPSNNRAFIFGSCNGIICFKTTDINNNHVDLVVWNPCTSKFKILPPLENLPKETFQTRYSIGYDSSIDNYKVVAVTCHQFDTKGFAKTQVRVHTLGTNFWKRIPDFPIEIMYVAYWYRGIFVSGTINWAVRGKHSSWVILSLDLRKESYQEISQPEYGPLFNLSLGVSNDCLCILAQNKTILDGWVMNEYGNKESWTKLFAVPSMKFLGCNDARASMLCISEEDNLVLIDIQLKVYAYNYKNGTVKIPNIQGLPSTSSPFKKFTSNVYVESLVSL
jgi:F-box interacting protein